MVVAQLCTPVKVISTASALVIATRSFGGTVGLAVNNALFNSALSTEVPEEDCSVRHAFRFPCVLNWDADWSAHCARLSTNCQSPRCDAADHRSLPGVLL